MATSSCKVNPSTLAMPALGCPSFRWSDEYQFTYLLHLVSNSAITLWTGDPVWHIMAKRKYLKLIMLEVEKKRQERESNPKFKCTFLWLFVQKSRIKKLVQKIDIKPHPSIRNWLKFSTLWRTLQTSTSISWTNIVCLTFIYMLGIKQGTTETKIPVLVGIAF